MTTGSFSMLLNLANCCTRLIFFKKITFHLRCTKRNVFSSPSDKNFFAIATLKKISVVSSGIVFPRCILDTVAKSAQSFSLKSIEWRNEQTKRAYFVLLRLKDVIIVTSNRKLKVLFVFITKDFLEVTVAQNSFVELLEIMPHPLSQCNSSII